jgi:DNA-directed RNA polymerase subunit M/transcription elongation factor TFIIS
MSESAEIAASLYTGKGWPERITHTHPIAQNCGHVDIMLQRHRLRSMDEVAYTYACIHCGEQINPLNIHIRPEREYRL